MPVQIGVSVHDFSHPTGLLSDCHRRIELFIDLLEAVGQVIDQPAADKTKRTLEAALRYFREAAPTHTADEEESLFPRLRCVKDPDAQAALAKLDQLEKDHQSAGPLHAEAERLGQLYLSRGILSSAEAGEFRIAIATLKSMYRQHISIEDQVVFPVAAALLPQSDQVVIGEEMAARRRVR
jgi:iron-sulfur cluster repair protein YtfE (RIC family)